MCYSVLGVCRTWPEIFISIRQQVGFLVSCSVFIGFLPVLLSFEYMEFCMLVAAYASHRFRTRKSDTLEDGKLVENLLSAGTFHHSLLRVLCIVGLRICLAMAVASMD